MIPNSEIEPRIFTNGAAFGLFIIIRDHSCDSWLNFCHQVHLLEKENDRRGRPSSLTGGDACFPHHGAGPPSRASTSCDVIDEIIEERTRPQIQFPGIPEENPNILGSFLKVHRLKSFLEETAQPLG